MPKFQGTSDKGNFQEALEKAVQEALGACSRTDNMVSYTLKKTIGRKGGFAGFDELTVVIEADLQGGRKK